MDAKEAIECLEHPDTSGFEKWLKAKHMAFEALEKVEILETENAQLKKGLRITADKAADRVNIYENDMHLLK